MKPTWIHILAASFAAMAIVCPRQATAESPATRSSDATTAAIDMAQELFDRAMAFMGQGKFAPAAELFQESLRLDPAIGTRYHLADCYEQMGRLALAWSHFNAVAELAKQERSQEREEVARGRATALEGRIGRVAISVPARLSGIAALSLTLDNRRLASRWAAGAVALEVVDPGRHTVEATAPGKERWRHAFEVKAGAMVRVTVDAFPPGMPERPAARVHLAPVIIGSALSVAAFGAGLGFFSQAEVAAKTYDDGVRWLTNGQSTVRSACGSDTPFLRECDAIADSNAQSQAFESGAIAWFVAGSALAAGTLTYALWPRRSLGTRPVELGSSFSPEGGRFFVRGRF